MQKHLVVTLFVLMGYKSNPCLHSRVQSHIISKKSHRQVHHVNAKNSEKGCSVLSWY